MAATAGVEASPSPLAKLGFEFREADDGRRRLFHVPSSTFVHEGNWRVLMAGDYGTVAAAAMPHIHRILEADAAAAVSWTPVPLTDDEVAHAPPDAPRSMVLATADLLTNPHGLLVLVPGSGEVRAGIWGRKLCVTDCLEHGTMAAMFRAARRRGWAAVSLDPNRTRSDGMAVLGSESAIAHCEKVWRRLVVPAAAAQIGVMAHSAGGSWLLHCLAAPHTPDDSLQRIAAIAFTDSVHTMASSRLDGPRMALLGARARHWRAGPGALDEAMDDDRAPPGRPDLGCGCECRYAGTADHASSNYAAWPSVVAWLDEHMEAAHVVGAPHAQAEWRKIAHAWRWASRLLHGPRGPPS